MKDKKDTLNKLWFFITVVTIVIMFVTFGLQIFAYDAMRHITLCGVIAFLCAVNVFLDMIMKDNKSAKSGIFASIAWFIAALINIPKL